MGLPLLALVAAAGNGSPRGFAAPSTPPPPPTFIPTPIGPPPPPPTMTPTAAPVSTATSTPVTTSTASASPTPTVTATANPAASLSFSVDAARVSPLNNPGDLQGLADVKPGTKVELMMYYTIKTLPKTVTRVTTYTVLAQNKPVYQVAYKNPEKAHDVGHFSRYTVYTIPKSLPYGPYVFRASLQLGTKARAATWKFRVAKQERLANTSGRP